MSSTVKAVVFWLVIVISASLLWQVVKGGQNNPQKTPEISYSEFLSQVESGNVSKVTISKSQVTGRYRNNDLFRVTPPPNQEGMLQTLHQNNVEIWFSNAAEADWPTWFLNLAPLILLAALWFFMIRQLRLRQNQGQINKQPDL